MVYRHGEGNAAIFNRLKGLLFLDIKVKILINRYIPVKEKGSGSLSVENFTG